MKYLIGIVFGLFLSFQCTFAQNMDAVKRGYEELWNDYHKKGAKQDAAAERFFLVNAPRYIQLLDGYEHDKWKVRIESFFADCLKRRGIKDMVNKDDFEILTKFSGTLPEKKQSEVFEYLVKNYGWACGEVDSVKVGDYLVGYYNTQIIRQCKNGSDNYRKLLARLDGDLKPVYASMKFGNMSVREAVTLLADASYNLYKKNDALFFEKMNLYFQGRGDDLDIEDYIQPITDLYEFYDGRLSTDSERQVIPWLDKALALSPSPSQRCRLLVMMGDCLQHLGNTQKAKQCFNQAFVASVSIESPYEKQSLQQAISEKSKGL